jgi:flagellar biosynthesis/type III secretory pathway M-ring protein FliF/YscJ
MSSPRQQVAAGGGGYASYAAPAAIENNVVDEAELARQAKTDEDRVAIREGIVDSANEDPRTTSNLVRKWLRESE